MIVKTLFFAAAGAAFCAVLVNAQAAPNWQYIPVACTDQCAQTVQVAYLCQTEFTTSTDTYGCFCSAFPSDAATCATCLNSNNAAALANLLTGDQTACPFDTCGSTDVGCQCDGTYLQNIYACGACNTANGNTGATQLKDWESLNDSCKNQNYTGAAASFSTKPLASPTGQAGYVALVLTATGGGEAATGDLTASTANRGGAAAGPTTMPASAATTAKGASTGLAKSTVLAAAASSAGTSAAGPATVTVTAASGAHGLAVPALGGLLAVAGAIHALF